MCNKLHGMQEDSGGPCKLYLGVCFGLVHAPDCWVLYMLVVITASCFSSLYMMQQPSGVPNVYEIAVSSIFGLVSHRSCYGWGQVLILDNDAPVCMMGHVHALACRFASFSRVSGWMALGCAGLLPLTEYSRVQV